MAQWLVDLPPIECASGATGCAFRHNFATVCNEKCFEKPSPSRPQASSSTQIDISKSGLSGIETTIS